MKIKFDPKQQFQIDAVNAITDIFEGLPLNNGSTKIDISLKSEGLFENINQNELGIGNHLSLSDDVILKNIHKIQDRNNIQKTPVLQGKNFSVEMETGTGKTYVYLRTIFELNKKYGFNKFIIVVPSIAIREGTLKNLQITEDHFKNIFDNTPFNYAVYDSKKMSIIKNFATSNQLQILIINIDAFRKDITDSEGEDKGVLFHRASEKLNGRSPREYIQSVNPIVIIDEPQSVDNTPKSKMAIQSLNPLCTLRYSATHINPYNLMYKLDPIKAYSLGLVKKISVTSTKSIENQNGAYVKLIEVDNKKGIKAKLSVLVQTNNGIKEKEISVKNGSDLYDLSKRYEEYKNGYQVSEINCEPGNEYILFSPSGIKLFIGQENGGLDGDVKKIQIRNTIEEHLKKIKQVKDKGIKVLSLFFIDRVSNYRDFSDEQSNKGKYARWFEESFNDLIKLDEYKDLIPHNVNEIHDGYFAEDKNGTWKDTNGLTKADESTYDKIMKNKEKLLSIEEPLQFIFSHSALREGWDNPNVFQICTLNETNAVMKKRQEIGRGLRLPVNQEGERIFDDSINKLVVIANESYEEFAKKLQTEYEQDCGVKFGLIPKGAFIGLSRFVDNNEIKIDSIISEEIWNDLKENKYIDEIGLLTKEFDIDNPNFSFKISDSFSDILGEIIDIMNSYRIEKHVTKHQIPRSIRLNKQVYLDKNFEELWQRINKKTTYSVNYSSQDLIDSVSEKVAEMEKIDSVKIQYVKADLEVDSKGVLTKEVKNQIIEIENNFKLPDILSYLQVVTNLTRKTIYSILEKSGRIQDFQVNPQKFMDKVAEMIKTELNKLIINGIKYERIAGKEYEMKLFEQNEMVSYLDSLLESKKSVYNYIEYDSEVEKRFALDLEKKENVKLFVKLPSWFLIDTPVGKYNPDWAILKQDEEALYLVRETKGTVNFELLRNSEAYKIKCGEEHFKELGVDFKTVINANEI